MKPQPSGDERRRGREVQPRADFSAFFSLFAARFSIRLLAGFFLTSFLVSLALLIFGPPIYRSLQRLLPHAAIVTRCKHACSSAASARA